jgi:hypothetical protein
VTRSVAALALLLGGVACASGETTAPASDDDDGGSGGAGGAETGGGAGAGGAAALQYVHFAVSGDGMDREETWTVPDNFVSCVGASALSMRFAVDPEGGEGGDHIDVDVFGYSGPGAYASVSCPGAGCPPPPPGSFSIWYHPNGGAAPVYTNDSTSMPCALTMQAPDVGVLEGMWVCESVSNIFGTGMTVDLTGDFRCAVPLP